MPFNSQNLQQICAKTVGSVSVPKNLKKAAKNIYALHKQKIAEKTQEAALKRYEAQQRLQGRKEKEASGNSLRDQKIVREFNRYDDAVSLALKRQNIRQARKLSERRARADELIDAVLSQPSKDIGSKNSSVRAETVETALKLSDLVI